jgi:hypothetical protein
MTAIAFPWALIAAEGLRMGINSIIAKNTQTEWLI